MRVKVMLREGLDPESALAEIQRILEQITGQGVSGRVAYSNVRTELTNVKATQ